MILEYNETVEIISAVVIILLIIIGFYVCYKCGVFGKQNDEKVLEQYQVFGDERL